MKTAVRSSMPPSREQKPGESVSGGSISAADVVYSLLLQCLGLFPCAPARPAGMLSAKSKRAGDAAYGILVVEYKGRNGKEDEQPSTKAWSFLAVRFFAVSECDALEKRSSVKTNTGQ